MYLVEIGMVGQTLVLKGFHCEARVAVSLGGVGRNLHLTST